MLVEYRKYRTAWQINNDWCFLAAQKNFREKFFNDFCYGICCGMETNLEKGIWLESRRSLMVEDENDWQPASQKRCSSTFVNESFNCNSSSFLTQSIS